MHYVPLCAQKSISFTPTVLPSLKYSVATTPNARSTGVTARNGVVTGSSHRRSRASGRTASCWSAESTKLRCQLMVLSSANGSFGGPVAGLMYRDAAGAIVKGDLNTLTLSMTDIRCLRCWSSRTGKDQAASRDKKMREIVERVSERHDFYSRHSG